MAKIDFPEGINPFLPSQLPKRKEEGTKVGKGRGPFRSLLGKAVEEASADSGSGGLAGEPYSSEALEKLLDDVHETGDRLKENPNVEMVQAYKKAVRDFIHHVVENSYSLERREGRKRLDQRVYFRIAVIDESLEKLGAEILRNQRDRLEILRRVDEINGLIIDFFR